MLPACHFARVPGVGAGGEGRRVECRVHTATLAMHVDPFGRLCDTEGPDHPMAALHVRSSTPEHAHACVCARRRHTHIPTYPRTQEQAITDGHMSIRLQPRKQVAYTTVHATTPVLIMPALMIMPMPMSMTMTIFISTTMTVAAAISVAVAVVILDPETQALNPRQPHPHWTRALPR